MTLETLADIETRLPEKDELDYGIVNSEELRKLIKEWIKDREEQLLSLKDTLKDNVCFPYNYQIIANGLQSQIYILKYIFNFKMENK